MIIYKCDACCIPSQTPHPNTINEKHICNSCNEKINLFIDSIRPYNELYEIGKTEKNKYFSYNNADCLAHEHRDLGYMKESNLTLVKRICDLLKIKDWYYGSYSCSEDGMEGEKAYIPFLYEGSIPTKRFLYEIIVKLHKLF